MERRHTRWLLGSAIWVMLIAIVSVLIASQWNKEALPFAALGAILVLTVIKSRIVILDFMGLRGMRPRLAAALIAWPAFFALVAVAKAAAQLLAS